MCGHECWKVGERRDGNMWMFCILSKTHQGIEGCVVKGTHNIRYSCEMAKQLQRDSLG